MKKITTICLFFFLTLSVNFAQTNLLPNASFELGDGSPFDWEKNTGYGANFFWSNQISRSGNYSVGISDLSLPWSQLAWTTKNNIIVEPNSNYELSVWVYIDNPLALGETAELDIREYDQNNNFITGHGIVANVIAGIWVECKRGFTTNALTHSLKISLAHIYRNNNNVAIVYFDDVSLIKNSPEQKIVLLSPNNNQTQVNPGTSFSWNPYSGATSYTIQINNINSFTNPFYTFNTNLTTFYLPQQLDQYSPYYWRVKADNSQWSDIWYFYTGQSYVPRLLEPKNNYAEVPSQNAFLQWTGINGATNYRVEVSEASNFSSLTYQREENSTQIWNLNFTEGKTYYWRVKAFVNSSWYGWSETFKFTVQTIQINIPNYKFFTVDAALYGNENLNFRGSLAGDLRGDGIKRIVIGGGKSGQLLIYKYQNNILIPDGSIQILQTPMDFSNIIPKAIGDVDGDGLNEIIVLTSGLSQQWQPNLLQIFKWNGNEYSELVSLNSNDFNIFDQSTIIIENVDQNSGNEIIMPVNGRLGIYRVTGNTLIKLAELNEIVEQKFAIGNCDSDPNLEIVISKLSPNWAPVELLVLGFNGNSFTYKSSIPGFEYPAAGISIQDLNEDGINEIFCSTGQYSSYNYLLNIYSFDGYTYNLIKNFRITSGITKSKFGDLDGDGKNEVVMFRNSSGSYVVDFENGSYIIGYLNHVGIVDDGDIIDIDSDGSGEILASAYGGFQIVSIVNEIPKLELISPANNQFVSNLSPTFEWKPLPNVQNYILYIRKGANFTPPSIYVQVVSGTSFTIPIVLEPNTQYSWRVRAQDQYLTLSEIRTFSTTTITKPVEVTYICNMQYEITSGRFKPSSDYVELRGNEFGWGPGVRMVQNLQNPNIYYFTFNHQIKEIGESLPEYKFWYSTIKGEEQWENTLNRSHMINEGEFNSGLANIQTTFNDVTTDNSTNRKTTLLFQIDLNNANDVFGNPLPTTISSVHLTGSSIPLTWKGWSTRNPYDMIRLFDNGTNGDQFAGDKIYSVLIEFNPYTKYRIEFTYVVNFEPNGPGQIPYENLPSDNHVILLENNLVRAKVFNKYGVMSNYGEIITPLYDNEYISSIEIQLALSDYKKIISLTTGKLQKDIKKSYDFFVRSLDNKLWLDDAHLNEQGQLEFELSKNAISELMKIEENNIYQTSLLPIIKHIFNSNKYIVELLLSELLEKYYQSGCQDNSSTGDCAKWKKDLEDAKELLTQVYSNYSKNKFDMAIQNLKIAWMNLRKVQNAGLAKESIQFAEQYELPTEYSLLQNYPNPFNPNTKISYQLPEASYITIKIYDTIGKEISTLINEYKSPGSYTVEFNGAHLPSGVYFYTMQAGNFVQTKKFVLLK